jgi:hypothetical protein
MYKEQQRLQQIMYTLHDLLFERSKTNHEAGDPASVSFSTKVKILQQFMKYDFVYYVFSVPDEVIGFFN